MSILISMGVVPMLAITLCVCLGGGVIRTWFNKTKTDSTFDIHIYNLILSIAAALGIFVLNGGFGGISLYTFLLAIAFGIVTALGNILNAKALTCGPWTYTSMIGSLSTIIPTLSGVIFWNEAFGVWRIIGVVLLLACFVLSTGKDKKGNKANFKWLIICLILFFVQGSIGLLQKIHQSSEHSGEIGAFLIIAFIISAAYSAVSATVCRKSSPSKVRWNFPLILLAVLAGIFAAFNNEINLYLVGVVETVVFFPVVNGGGLILTALVSVIFFKERFTVKQWIGLGIGALSLVCICLMPELIVL